MITLTINYINKALDSPFFQDIDSPKLIDEANKKGNWGWKTVYNLKKFNAFLSDSVNNADKFAVSPSRHVPSHILGMILSTQTLARCTPLLAPLNGLVTLVDLSQPLCETHYWTCEAPKDWKNGKYLSLAIHTALGPTNLLYWVWFARDNGIAKFEFLGKAANAIGGIRGFGFMKSDAFSVGSCCLASLAIAYGLSVVSDCRDYKRLKNTQSNKDPNQQIEIAKTFNSCVANSAKLGQNLLSLSSVMKVRVLSPIASNKYVLGTLGTVAFIYAGRNAYISWKQTRGIAIQNQSLHVA